VTGSLSSDSLNGEGSSLSYCIITPTHSSCSVGFRIHAELVTDRLLQDAIYSAHNTLGRVLEFVAELDDRQFPRNYGYFVELEGELGAYHIPAC